MPAGHGTTDTTPPATGLYTPGELDVTGAGGGGTFSDFLALMVTPMITLGKLILTRLAALEAKAILQRTTNLACATATLVDLTYDVADLVASGLGGALSITRSTGLIVCATPGTYKFTLDAEFAFNTTGVRVAVFQKALAAAPTVFTETVNAMGGSFLGGALGGPSQVPAIYYATLAAGDVVKAGVSQNSGGALNLTTAHLEIRKVA